MSNYARRPRRILAGVLAGALALSVTPILGLTGVASAADELPELADPIGDGNFCENMPEEEPFTDVSDSDSSIDEITCLFQTGLTTGVTATTYQPAATITRRQMALFIVRLADEAKALETTAGAVEELPAYDNEADFGDIDEESSEVQAAIGQLNQAGIVEGVTTDEYQPGAPVSRRQMAAFVYRLYQFLTGDDIAITGDYFDDDEGDSGEENLNAMAEAGIFQGDGAGNVNPGSALSRRQMANILTRGLERLFEDGFIENGFELPEPDLNVFEVGDGTKGSALGPDGARTCIVSGIEAGATVDVALFPSADVRIAEDGTVTFTDAAPANNLADNEGGVAFTAIVNVNGAPAAGTEVNNVVSPTGQLSVTMAAGAAEDVTLVVWQDNAGFTGNSLDLAVPAVANGNPKAPREMFGVGCRTLFAPETPGGPFGGVVTTTDKESNLLTAGGANVFYDSNDTFQIGGVPQAAGEAGLAAFEALLSPGDTVSGTYAPDPAGVSTINLTDAAPAPATALTATVNGTTVTLNFTGSATPTADSYNIYRIVRPASGTCPNFDTAGVAGRAQWPATATVNRLDPQPSVASEPVTYDDAGLAPNTVYCYAVTAVDDGDESGPATAQAFDVSTTAVGTAPTIVDVRARDLGLVGVVDTGDLHQFIFSEPMNTSTDAAGETYRVQDADGTIGEIVCGTNGTCALQAGGTYNGTVYPADQVLRVTVTAPVTPLAGFLGTTPGLQYPVTVTNVSAGWDDAGGAQLNLGGSADTSVDVGAITP